jgi:hypothetical protein
MFPRQWQGRLKGKLHAGRTVRRGLLIELLEERNVLSFLPPVAYSVGSSPKNIAVADLNGDSIPDLVVTDYGGSSGAVSILLGNGDGTFQDARTQNSGGNGPVDVKVADYSGKGVGDLIVSNYFSDNLSVLLGNGDGTFARGRPFLFTRNPWDFQILGATKGEFDLAITNSLDRRLQVIRGGDSRFYTTGDSPLTITTADLRGNGIVDLVVSNRQSNSVSVLLGNGDGTFRAARNFATDIHPDQVIVGDFDGDRIPDLATANFDAHTVTVLLGNGDGTFRFVANFSAGFYPISVAAADLRGNGTLDLVTTSATTSDVAVLLGNGDGTFQYPVFFPAALGTDHVAVADVDGDGTPDLIVTSFARNELLVMLNDGIWQKSPGIALAAKSKAEASRDLTTQTPDHPVRAFCATANECSEMARPSSAGSSDAPYQRRSQNRASADTTAGGNPSISGIGLFVGSEFLSL